jgi:hypothetical protein
MERHVVRLATVWRRRVRGLDVTRKATRAAVLEERGTPANEVAYLLDINQQTVERYRREAGRNAQTGEPRPDRPLTAPAHVAIQKVEADQ